MPYRLAIALCVLFFACLIACDGCYYITAFLKLQPLFLIFFNFFVFSCRASLKMPILRGFAMVCKFTIFSFLYYYTVDVIAFSHKALQHYNNFIKSRKTVIACAHAITVFLISDNSYFKSSNSFSAYTPSSISLANDFTT